MNQLYKTIGISKQAVSQYDKRQQIFNAKVHNLILDAQELKEEHPGCGVEKMYFSLNPKFIGRDRFIDLFMDLGFRVKRNKNYRRTTYASPVNYPNLIKGMIVDKPSAIWQSDITYIQAGDRFYYAVFIIDVYTKVIVGYQLSSHMRASANCDALRQALKCHKAPIIHHSDRGSQYGSTEYIKLLEDNNTQISMAKSAQDNAYAERINKTIKEEYLNYWKPKSFDQLKSLLKKAVYHYNNKRPHDNLKKLKPREFENRWYNNQLDYYPFFTIFDNEN